MKWQGHPTTVILTGTNSPTTPILISPVPREISLLCNTFKEETPTAWHVQMTLSRSEPPRLTLPFLSTGHIWREMVTFQCHMAVTLQSVTLKEEGSKPIGCAEILNTLSQQGVCVVSASSIIALQVKTGERATTAKTPPHSCKLLINC